MRPAMRPAGVHVHEAQMGGAGGDEQRLPLSQRGGAEAFGKGVRTGHRQVAARAQQHIFKEGELQKDSVCREFRRTASDGKDYSTQFYNLDAIISVGYRANSARATQFRQWATAVLRQFAIRG
ncbi:MAG: virulence RhuM family protein [Muribaculaceae bacterium]|nr:virulence RhuM family protein [Muribaculaceae bacterium]